MSGAQARTQCYGAAMQRNGRTIAVGVIIVVVVAAALVKFRSCGPATKPQVAVPAAVDPWANQSASSDGDLLASKLRARNGAPADVSPATVSGKVTRRSDGAGVGGAVVFVEPDQIGGNAFAEISGVDTSVTALADGNGVWTAIVAPGKYIVAAAAENYLPSTRNDVAVAAREHKTGVDLILDAGSVNLTGTVTDIGGGPVVAARVTLKADEGLASLFSRGSTATFTDQNGSYRMALPAGDWRATVTQEDYVESEKSTTIAATPVILDFVLSPGATIRGQVVARADGKPVAHALVHADSKHLGKGGATDGANAVLADAQGNFVLRRVGWGAVELTATARNFRSSAPTVVELGIGEQVADVKIAVDRAFTISGFVVKKDSKGDGVPGVIVGGFSFGNKDGVVAQTPSAPDGYFELLGVNPGTYFLGALGAEVIPNIGKSVTVKDADVTDVLITMEAGVTLAGAVSPAARASLSLQLAEGVSGIGDIFDAVKVAMAQTQSDDAGVFVMRNVPDGKFVLVARTREGRVGKLPVTVNAVDQKGLLVTLTPHAGVVGVVVDENGKPVVGVTVTAFGGATADLNMGTDHNEAKTRFGGGFRIVGLDPGSYAISVRDEHGALRLIKQPQAELPTSMRLELSDEVKTQNLTVETRDGVIRGTVLGLNGQPQADAWVSAQLMPETKPGVPADHSVSVTISSSGSRTETSSEQPAWMASSPLVLSDDNGRFEIAELRKGAYRVTADGAKGTSRATKAPVALGSTVTLQLASLGAVYGKVGYNGAVVTQFDVKCTGVGTSLDRHFNAADGGYEFARVPDGELTCDASATEGQAQGRVKLIASADNAGSPDATVVPTRLDFALLPWSAVTGQLVNVLTDAGVEGAQVFHDRMGVADMGELFTGTLPTTDATGHFVVEKVAAGGGKLVFNWGGILVMQSLGERAFTLTAGQRLDLGAIKVVPPRRGAKGTLGLTLDELRVTALVPAGPAANAGLHVGDLVVAIATKPVAQLGELAAPLLDDDNVAAGQSLALQIMRAGAPMEVSVLAGPAAK